MKNKFLAGVATVAGLSSFAAADITVNGSSISGSLDTAPFMSVAGIVIVALGAMWGIKKAIGLFR